MRVRLGDAVTSSNGPRCRSGARSGVASPIAQPRTVRRATVAGHSPCRDMAVAVRHAARVRYHVVTLLTDYGIEDGFVAACHGVLLTLAPRLRLVDVTHLVPPQDVRRGAAVLAQTVPWLPPAVHVAVVDPDVGTSRRGIAVAAGQSVLVGPDNGLLLPAAEALGGILEAVELTERRFFAAEVARTFHGRDVFAPVAAHVAGGVPLPDLGPAVDPASLVRLPPPLVVVRDGVVEAEVLT